METLVNKQHDVMTFINLVSLALDMAISVPYPKQPTSSLSFKLLVESSTLELLLVLLLLYHLHCLMINCGFISKGLIFTKIARPSRMRGTILFSDVAVVNYKQPRYIGSVDQLEAGRWFDPHLESPQQIPKNAPMIPQNMPMPIQRSPAEAAVSPTPNTLAAYEDDANCPCLVIR